jgi:hypothetical protein
MDCSLRPPVDVEHYMRKFWLAATLVVAQLTSLAAPRAVLPPDLRHLTGLAASLPPEFQADTLLQIVESRGGLDPALKRDLIERAFVAAGQSRNPYPQVAVHGIDPDSRQAFQAGASSIKLDRLSLEARAVRLMVAFEPLAARQLFLEIQKPVVAMGSCGDALIPQLDDYYEMAAPVILRGFTPKEIDRQEPLGLLLRILAGVSAPYEIGPAARLILNANVTPQQFEVALSAFAARIETIAPDDRSFGETGSAVQGGIASLESRAAASSGAVRTVLARAYRKYLTSNYGKARCGDSAGGRIAGTPMTNPVDWFNESDLRGDLPLIDIKEITFTGSGDRLKLDTYWAAPDSAKILTAAQGLRSSPGGLTWSLEQRSSSEWTQRLDSFLAQLSEWKQSGEESELDFFNEKAIVYQSLIDLCPAGDSRQRLVLAFVDFLKGSNAAAQNPVDWFWHAQNIYRRLGQAGDADGAKVMAAYKASGNLILEVYVRLSGH